MEKGISVYVGLGDTVDTLMEYINCARKYGYSRIFTSLHIPEADSRELLRDFRHMTSYAKQLGFAVTADISPHSFAVLGILPGNMEELNKLGVDTLRLDFGFKLQEVAALAKASRLTIELNASTVDEKLLCAIIGEGIAPGRLRACHNFYPRPETGLSYAHFAARSQVFRKYGIPVAAFIPSLTKPRPPLQEGLPTLEAHRGLKPVVAAKHLSASKLVDGIIFGDSMASSEELTAVAALKEDCIELAVEVVKSISEVERGLLQGQHTNRLDPGEHVIRSQEARGRCQGLIPPGLVLPRIRGAVTIDNSRCLRYMGELQIVCRSLPVNERVNVVAQIKPEELFLLDYIDPGSAFCFIE